MAEQLEGVKRAVAQLADETAGLGTAMSFAIATFTESDRHGCFASLEEFGSAAEACAYVRGLKLSTPPDSPDLNACGDDGPENHKAALVRLRTLDPCIPTIGFLITDAPPHLQRHDSRRTSRTRTPTHELEWLVAQGLPLEEAKDMFGVLRGVLEHFAGKLVLNCVVYDLTADEDLPRVWGRVARATGGMLLAPQTGQSSVLANGMLQVVRALLSRLVPGQPDHGLSTLEGFRLMDTSGLTEAEDEQGLNDGDGVVEGDPEEQFTIAMERICAVCGTKWSKRAVGLTAPKEQLEFVWRTARYVAARAAAKGASSDSAATDAAADELSALLSLRESIVGQLPDTARGHFSITEGDVRELAAEAEGAEGSPLEAAAAAGGAAGAGAHVPASVISLESVGEALGEDADWEDWLASVMRLMLGFAVRLQLPLDRDGRPDFMDAWSAVPEAVGIDRMSAADFMLLVADGEAARGPTDKASVYNALLALAEPGDAWGSLVFRIASGTQVLNYITGVTMGAKGFLPNLHAGAAASVLTHILSDPSPSEFRWGQALALAHTLRSAHRPPAATLGRQLAAGCANPADPATKLIAAALGLSKAAARRGAGGAGSGAPPPTAVLRLVLEEWLAALMQRHYGKRTPETDAEYLESVQSYVPLRLLVGGVGATAAPGLEGAAERGLMDPLESFHPLDPAGGALSAGPASVAPGWRAAALERLRGGGGGEGPRQHGVLRGFQTCARALLRLIHGDVAGGECALEAVWPDWEEGVLRALLLRQRTARYKLIKEEGGGTAEGEGGAAPEERWERSPDASLEELALGRLSEAHAGELAAHRRARGAAAHAALLAAAAEALRRAGAEGDADPEEYSRALEGLYIAAQPKGACGAAAGLWGAAPRPEGLPRGPGATLLGTTLSLGRCDVPRLLEVWQAAGGAAARPEGAPPPADAAAPAAPAAPVSGPLLEALVTGGWTTAPPQALRSSAAVLQLCSGREDLTEAIMARPRCMRIKGANQHGHSEGLQYPGPAGWTPAYAEARRSACEGARGARRAARARRYLLQMEAFAAEAAEARRAAAGDEGRLAAVEAALSRWDDANLLPLVRLELQRICDGEGGGPAGGTKVSRARRRARRAAAAAAAQAAVPTAGGKA